jgi:hypothetical protein
MGPTNVRFGSKADICGAQSHVRFAPNSDRESEIPQKVGATTDVRFGPKADIGALGSARVEKEAKTRCVA